MNDRTAILKKMEFDRKLEKNWMEGKATGRKGKQLIEINWFEGVPVGLEIFEPRRM